LIGKIMENYKCNPKRGKVKVILTIFEHI
jgi:hypothetical protein